MSATTPALLAAAAGVGFGHAVLPDHWAPLAVVGRTRRYPLRRVARLSLLAGIAHVLVSIAIGGVIIIVGLQLRSTVQSAQDTIIGCLLIATGIGFVLLDVRGAGHRHHGHEHHEAQHQDQEHQREPARGRAHGARRDARGLAAIMVPFGAAASPDLTILPVFLAATTSGVATAVGALVIFAGVTIATIVGLTLVAAGAGYGIQGQWLDRWGNAFTAAVLVVIGTLVLSGVL
jgi:nickel/cobalt exporter